MSDDLSLDYFNNLDIERIKKLLVNIDYVVEILHQEGKTIPCVEKNVVQIKALINLLKIECMDIG